ncbi:hypothetical protein Adt_06835 [Abeliophyllum distichum]|uniref:Uncharacterized protein n=1 Tax=Abeliophyllum distichum TaxID=126358 RepID=A0ABD1V817_9LAMI
MANSQAFKAKLVAFNKEYKEKMKEEAALRTLKNKLAVFELEQSISREINKVDCLEEEVRTTKDLDDEAMEITKPEHAQAQDLLVKVNIGNGREDRPTFVSQILSKEVSDQLIVLLKEYKDCLLGNMNTCPV